MTTGSDFYVERRQSESLKVGNGHIGDRYEDRLIGTSNHEFGLPGSGYSQVSAYAPLPS